MSMPSRRATFARMAALFGAGGRETLIRVTLPLAEAPEVARLDIIEGRHRDRPLP